MADAAVAAAGQGHKVYFVTVEPAAEFFSSGGRETMVNLLRPLKGALRIISQPVGFTFEFGSEVYRAAIYKTLIANNVPEGTPVILSDDGAVWSAACALADKYAVTGVLHGDQDYYYDRAAAYHRQLSLCVCVSARIKRTLLVKCPDIDAKKVMTIPCGINLPEYRPEPNSGDVLQLAFIGRLTDYEKRAGDLVLIAEELQRGGVSYHLHIAGNSDSSAITFRDSFRAKGVEPNVTFHGWQAKAAVQQMLNASDILLLTSNSEGMPLVMMEALASGCGFTGTRVSGIEDYEHHALAARCVAVYAVGEIDDAVNKIMQVAAVPAALRRQSARTLAEAEFGMDTCLSRYFAALQAIGKKQMPPSPLALSATDKIRSQVLATLRYMKVKAMNKKL